MIGNYLRKTARFAMFFLALAMGLPNASFALRPAGLEENGAINEVLTRLKTGLEEKIEAGDSRPRTYPADQDLTLRLGGASAVRVSAIPGTSIEVVPQGNTTVVLSGQEKGLTAGPGEEIQIGRAPPPAGVRRLVLPQDGMVSRLHASVMLVTEGKNEGKGIQVRNLSATNALRIETVSVARSMAPDGRSPEQRVLDEIRQAAKELQVDADHLGSVLSDLERIMPYSPAERVRMDRRGWHIALSDRVERIVDAYRGEMTKAELLAWLQGADGVAIDVGLAEQQSAKRKLDRLEPAFALIQQDFPESLLGDLEPEELAALRAELFRVGHALPYPADVAPKDRDRLAQLKKRIETLDKLAERYLYAMQIEWVGLPALGLVEQVARLASNGRGIGVGNYDYHDVPTYRIPPVMARAFFSPKASVYRSEGGLDRLLEKLRELGQVNEVSGYESSAEAVSDNYRSLMMDAEGLAQLQRLAGRVQIGDSIRGRFGEGGAEVSIQVSQISKGRMTYQVFGGPQETKEIPRKDLEEAIRSGQASFQESAGLEEKEISITDFVGNGKYVAGLPERQRDLAQTLLNNGAVTVAAGAVRDAFRLVTDLDLAAVADANLKQSPVEGVQFIVSGELRTEQNFQGEGLIIPSRQQGPFYRSEISFRVLDPVSEQQMQALTPLAWIALNLDRNLTVDQVLNLHLFLLTSRDEQGRTIYAVFA